MKNIVFYEVFSFNSFNEKSDWGRGGTALLHISLFSIIFVLLPR